MKKLIIVLLIPLPVVACSVDGQVEDLTVREKVLVPGALRGIVSGAQQLRDVNGYQVSASAGYFANGMYKEVKSYKVYVSIEGGLAADSFEERIQ